MKSPAPKPVPQGAAMEWIGEKQIGKMSRGGTRYSKKVKRTTFPGIRLGVDEFYVGDVVLLQSGDDDMPYIGQILAFFVSSTELHTRTTDSPTTDPPITLKYMHM